MRLFKSTAKTAAAPSPVGQTTPPRTTIHHHHSGPSPLGIALAGVIGVVAVVALVWYGGIFLLDEFGVRDPEGTWATILVGIPVFLFLVWSWNTLAAQKDQKKMDHERAMELLKLERLRLRRGSRPGFLHDSKVGGDMRLAELIMTIMQSAYQYLEDFGRFQGQERPWSRRQAADIVLSSLGEIEPVGETLGARAKKFLIRYQVIVNNQLNTTRYPDLDDVRMLLSLPSTPMMLPGGEVNANSADVYSIVD